MAMVTLTSCQRALAGIFRTCTEVKEKAGFSGLFFGEAHADLHPKQ